MVLLYNSITLAGPPDLNYYRASSYCIDIADANNPIVLESLAKRIDCKMAPGLRIDRFKGRYILRFGPFASFDLAKQHSQTLKRAGLSFRLSECNKDKTLKVLCPGIFNLTLKDLGYPSDMVFSGNSFYHIFYVPILPSFVEGVFYLKMYLAPTVPENGKILVYINDLPYKTYLVKDLGYKPTLEIPILAPAGKYSQFSKIKISFDFLPEDNICKALNDSSKYVVIYNSSQLLIKTRAVSPDTVYQYLLTYSPAFAIKAHSKFDIANVAYFLAGFYKKLGLYNLSFYFKDTESSQIVVQPKGENVLKGGRLYLSSPNINLLKNPNWLQASKFYANKFSEDFDANFLTELNNFIPLRTFGFQTTTQYGVGRINYKFSVPFQGFKGKPIEMIFLLRFAVQQISERNSDRVWCNLIVNNQLIWSKEIVTEDSASLTQEYVIKVPDYVLYYGDNVFQVSFDYYPGNKTCTGSVPKLKTTLFDSSAILVSRVDDSYRNVRDLLSSLSGNVGVFVDPALPEEFVAEVFKLLGYFNAHVSGLEDVNNLKKPADFVVVLAYFKNLKDMQDVPVVFDKQIVIYNPLTQKKVLELSGDYKFLLFQSGKFKERPALYITPTDKESCEIIYDFDWSYLNKLVGNANFVYKRSLYALEVGKKFRVEYKFQTKLKYYLKKFKLLLFLLFFIVLTMFVIYLWRRMT